MAERKKVDFTSTADERELEHLEFLEDDLKRLEKYERENRDLGRNRSNAWRVSAAQQSLDNYRAHLEDKFWDSPVGQSIKNKKNMNIAFTIGNKRQGKSFGVGIPGAAGAHHLRNHIAQFLGGKRRKTRRKTRRRKRKTKKRCRKTRRKTRKRKTKRRRRGGMNGSTGGTGSTPLPRPSTSPGSTGSRDLHDEAQRRIQEERIAERRRILQVQARENARVMQIIARQREDRRRALSNEGSSGRGLGGGKRRKRRKTKKKSRRKLKKKH